MNGAELWVEVATRIWRAIELALPNLPEDLRAALGWRVEDGDMRWALALMLAAWRLTDPREPRAGEVSALAKALGAAPLIGQVNTLRAVDGFAPFVDRARDADSEAKLKGAAVRLVSAIQGLDRVGQALLVEMLRRPEVREVGRVLVRRFPTPGAERPPAVGAPGGAPRRSLSRGELFERADYGSRERALRPAPVQLRARLDEEDEEDEDGESPMIPAPVLDDRALAVAHLHALGYSAEQVSQLLAGPPGLRA